MRILSVIAQKPGSTGSGIYLRETVKAFDSLGIEQAIVAGAAPDDKVELPCSDLRFFPIKYEDSSIPFPVLGMSDEMPYKSTRYIDLTEDMADIFLSGALDAVREAVGRLRPDVILCHHLYLMTAAVREAYPDICVAAVCHGTDIRQMEKHDLRHRYICDNIKKLNRVFALHEAQADDIIRVYGVKPERITVIGCGYNENIFRDMHFERQISAIKYIYAGKISSKKGLKSLLRAYDGIDSGGRPMVLNLAGGGEGCDADSIRMMASQCSNPVNMLGRLEQDDLARELNASDVFVLPSFYEGLPLIVAEAMACGLRVVCTELKGVPQWFESNIKDAPIEYVRLPRLQNTDEPCCEDLADFEIRLRETMQRAAIEGRPKSPPDMSSITWRGLGSRIADILKTDVAVLEEGIH